MKATRIKAYAILVLMTLSMVLFYVIVCGIFVTLDAEEDGDGDGGNILQLQDGLEATKIILSLFILAVACGTLFAPIQNIEEEGVHEKFNAGVLVTSMFMFGNMLIVNFMYFVNLDFGVSA